MSAKPRSNSRTVNRLNAQAKHLTQQIARLLGEAEHKAAQGNLDAVQRYHLKISELLVKVYDLQMEIQAICKANGD